ncbi:MAG TPA: UvrD-helicase domain-containing protein [Tenuifilaceae bacterium]|nr:UvrD-helicase domain-containing protein [Tenuifilaceae bacterium]
MSRLVVYRASAGSGKTFRLAAEYIRMVVTNPYAYRIILAVTFTNKATTEMKERILSELNQLAGGASTPMLEVIISESKLSETTIRQNAKSVLHAILHDYSMFSVSTIDSFVQRVIQNLLWEVGFHSLGELMLEHDAILDRAVDRLLDSTNGDSELFTHLKSMIFYQLDQGKSPDIKKSLVELGNLLYSEQYRLLTDEERAKMGDKSLLVNITTQATERLNAIVQTICSMGKALMQEISSNGFTVDDFKNKSGGVYGFIEKTANFSLGFNYIEVGERASVASQDYTGDQWMSREFVKANPGKSSELQHLVQQSLQPGLARLVEYIEDNRSMFNTTTALRSNLNRLYIVNEIRRYIKEIQAEDNVMVLADSGPLLREFIGENDAPFVYEKIGTRYDSFMLDEFQDTSVIQWQNFKPLVGNSLAQDGFSMVVGDVKQAIYRWRNSDWRILASQLEEDFEVEPRNLSVNFRSLPGIVNFNNQFFGKAATWLKGWVNRLFEDNPPEDLLKVVEKLYGGAAQESKFHEAVGGLVEVSCFQNIKAGRYDEFLKRKFSMLIPDILKRGYRPGDVAILVRKHSEGKKIADMLLSLKNENPEWADSFNLVSQDALLLDSSHAIRLFISALKLILNTNDGVSRGVFCKESMVVAKISTSWEHTFVGSDIDDEIARLTGLRNLPLSTIFEEVLLRYNLQELKQELPYIALLNEQILNYSHGNLASVAGFLEWWDDRGHEVSLSLPDSADAINILTFHKSKGLEFPVVIIPYASNSIFKNDKEKALWVSSATEPYCDYPKFLIGMADYLKDSDFRDDYLAEKFQTMVDNLNLLYVAFTRPQNELYVMLSHQADDPKTVQDTGDIILSIVKDMDAPEFTDDRFADISALAVYQFGLVAPIPKTSESKVENRPDVWLMEQYPVGKKIPSLAGHLEASDFFKDEELTVTSGVEHGRIMHRLFSMIRGIGDVSMAVSRLVAEGLISLQQAPALEQHVSEAIQNDAVADWFSEKWQELKVEASILTPTGQTYRPDRVMVSNGHAVVVDFKFGEQQNAHKKQVAGYSELLSQMGYPNVTGYLWYFDSGSIVRV